MIPRFISDYGLSEFVLNGLEKDILIDMGAMRHILEETHELKKLRISNVDKANPESSSKLIAMVLDLI